MTYRWSSAFPGEELRENNSTLVEFTLSTEGGEARLCVIESGFAALAGSQESREETIPVRRRRPVSGVPGGLGAGGWYSAGLGGVGAGGRYPVRLGGMRAGQPQQPPPQQPPPLCGGAAAPPVMATVDSSFTVSS